MSNWIRINDDTYIDDSLVTCAEYQLFIDEMREQGKYHQPDHWKEYRFPKGQARQPILGMRHSDATLFCQWLTERNQDGWRYHLPNETQAQKHPIQKPYTPPIGYWLQGTGTAGFAWAGAKPSNPRGRALDRARDLVHAVARARTRALDIDLHRDGALDIDRDRAIDRARARAFESAFGSAHDRTRALDLYTDIITIQSRMDGTSPAFEGIRLVRERIK